MLSFHNLLVHVDTRVDEQPIVDRALALAQRHHARVRLVDVLPPFSWPARWAVGDLDQVRLALEHQKQAALAVHAERLRAAGIETSYAVLVGKSSTALVDEVVRGGHDLLLKSAKGSHSRQESAFGTTALRLVRTCPCTVWAVRSPRPGAGRVAVAVDASTTEPRHATLNERLLHVAQAFAGPAPLEVVHAWSLYGEQMVKDYMKREDYEELLRDGETRARDGLSRLLSAAGLAGAAAHLLHGHASEEIGRFVAEQAIDVLVIGTVARSGLSGYILGNTAETLINRVECSLAVVKPADFAA